MRATSVFSDAQKSDRRDFENDANDLSGLQANIT